MSATSQKLLGLLPAIYRLRDLERGGPLAALFEVLGEHVELLEENLWQLYDDQFIETCADWVAPYLGDLVGYRPLHGVVPAISSPRAEVANTIRFRRRKGTVSMLEELASDVTDWSVRAVEFFEWLAWNQYSKHTRIDPPRGGTLSLRDADACDRVTRARGAFDSSAHNVDVRRISRGVGRYAIRNVGLFIWRLEAFPVTRSDARKIADGRYTFNPLGLDTPLFNVPQQETEFTHLAQEHNVPSLLHRRMTLDAQRPVFEVFIDDEESAVAVAEIRICHLADWHEPPADVDGQRIRVAVDPVLGRLSFPSGELPERVRVSHAYGFAARIGGGPYDRLKSLAAYRDREIAWQVAVSASQPEEPGRVFSSLSEAIEVWNTQPAGTVGVITVLDSATYTGNLSGEARIQIPGGSRLVIEAADGARPHVDGDISVVGTAAAGDPNPGELVLNGLLVEGLLTVLVGNLGSLTLAHCTIAPGVGELIVNASSADDGKRNSGLRVTLDHSISGPISMPEIAWRLQIADSIVSNGVEVDDVERAIDAAAVTADIRRSTVFGATAVGILGARNSIFTGLVAAARRQTGCIAFSWLPPESSGPRRYRCQPDVTPGIKPTFTSRRYGDPGFAQLGAQVPAGIGEGAEDESEMGVFHDLFQPQRATNLRVRLDEYLRFGFEAGVIYVT